MGVLPSCVLVCPMCMQCRQGLEEGITSPGPVQARLKDKLVQEGFLSKSAMPLPKWLVEVENSTVVNSSCLSDNEPMRLERWLSD